MELTIVLIIFALGLLAVSYTHLDVYKRQDDGVQIAQSCVTLGGQHQSFRAADVYKRQFLGYLGAGDQSKNSHHQPGSQERKNRAGHHRLPAADAELSLIHISAGVQHDAGQQSMGFQRGDVVFLRHKLQKFTDQLTGAGRIGLSLIHISCLQNARFWEAFPSRLSCSVRHNG